MMDHMTYASKSPEKSSPSFPEDAEDEDEDPMGLDHLKYSSTAATEKHNGVSISESNVPMDVTMLPEDEDDEIEPSRSFLLNVDSPRHPIDSSDKKVHWSNQNVQTLLDCVEKHLDEFNIQKKHKQVWQTIGSEMEPLGFTMEHCYNKWKNLRRDVRLLVNNPQKAVRNADILRRVARLILVIYPNIDATTMQVSGDRISSGGKSTPTTPGGPVNLYNRITSGATALHAPDSPLYYGISKTRTPNPITPNFHTFTPNGVKHKNEQQMNESPVPGTALFTNLHLGNEKRELLNGLTEMNDGNNDNANTNGNGFPFFLNPAAAALLVQSQLFNDLLRQQNQTLKKDESVHLDSVQQRQQLFAAGAKDLTTITNSSLNNGRSYLDGQDKQTSSLVNNLLQNIGSMDASASINHSYHNLFNSTDLSILNNSALDRLPPGSELASVVERLRNEETVHMRLTDLVTNLADELKAAGMRRRATLDQLLEIMQGTHRLPSVLSQASKTASETGHRV